MDWVRFEDWLKPAGLTPVQFFLLAGSSVLLVVATVVAYVFIKKLRVPIWEPPPDLDLILTDLGEAGPPETGPQLEFYSLPVRLAAVVLAPAGRGRTLLPENTGALLEEIVPGLGRVFAAHQPQVRIWPAQVSQQGFAVSFFSRLRRVGGRGLPGRRGKDTPWSAVAGRFDGGDRPLLAGLIVHAAARNNLGQFILERDTQWLDVLRVKD